MIYKMYISRKCYYQFFKGGNRKLIKKKKDIKKNGILQYLEEFLRNCINYKKNANRSI